MLQIKICIKPDRHGKSSSQPNGSGRQGSMCWISIHATTLMLMCSRMTLNNTDNLWAWFCVLPQVALWGKGILCHLMAISTALSIFFYVDSFFFQFYIIFEGGCEFEEYFSSLSLKILSTKVSNKQIRPIPKPKTSVRPALIFNNFSHISIFIIVRRLLCKRKQWAFFKQINLLIKQLLWLSNHVGIFEKAEWRNTSVLTVLFCLVQPCS